MIRGARGRKMSPAVRARDPSTAREVNLSADFSNRMRAHHERIEETAMLDTSLTKRGQVFGGPPTGGFNIQIQRA